MCNPAPNPEAMCYTYAPKTRVLDTLRNKI